MTAAAEPGSCRVCGWNLFPFPLLEYHNMPAVAQHLPDSHNLKDDAGVDLCIYQCSGCGLVQLDIEPVPYYREVIRAAGVSPEMIAFRKRQFAQFVNTHGLTGKKIIELGAGRGEYLSLLHQMDVEAYGLEYGESAVQVCRREGLNVLRGSLAEDERPIANGPFDAFCMLSVFEHLPEPNKALRRLHANLTENAVGLVEVPNFDMILSQKLFAEFMRDHLFYFTERTLTAVLERNGFEVMRIDRVWYDYILSALVKKRTPADLSAFAAYQVQLSRDIDNFLARFQTVAVWGASHQAFAIMALMNLGGRVKYVVDSAVFKQGKFTPASHIPIRAPEALRTEPVGAVIVMAGSYSDEIQKIVVRDFPWIRLAVLRDFGLQVIP